MSRKPKKEKKSRGELIAMNKGTKILKKCLCSFLTLLFFLSYAESVHATEENTKDLSYNSVVEVESYNIDEGYIEAGKNTNLTLTLHNSNKFTEANSLVVLFSSGSGMVYPAYGNDNQIYIGTLQAGESTTVSIPITVNSGFDEELADISCDLIYESGGNKITNRVSMILPSEKVNEVVVRSVEVSAHAIKNGKSLLSIVYGNNSNKNISDAEILIEGNVSDATKNIKLESLIAGKEYTKDFNIAFTEAGEQSITISLKYTSSDDELIKLDLGTYNVNVDEENAPKVIEENKNEILILVGRAVALMAAFGLIIAVFVYVKRKLF